MDDLLEADFLARNVYVNLLGEPRPPFGDLGSSGSGPLDTMSRLINVG